VAAATWQERQERELAQWQADKDLRLPSEKRRVAEGFRDLLAKLGRGSGEYG
jgi:hypothetical protein